MKELQTDRSTARLHVGTIMASLLFALSMTAGGTAAARSLAVSTAAGARLFYPLGIAIDRAGHIYVTEYERADVVELSAEGGLLARWGNTGPARTRLQGPEGIAIDRRGNVYVADKYLARVLEYSPAHKLVTSFTGTGKAQLQEPEGVAIDTDGNLFVSDHAGRSVAKFDPSRRMAAHWNLGQYIFPDLLAVDGTDNVYIADSLSNTVDKLSPIGKHLASFGHDYIGIPLGVAVTAQGNIIVTDWGQYADHVFEFDLHGKLRWALKLKDAGVGHYSAAAGVAIDSRGFIYVANMELNQVEKLSPGGKVLAVWK